jgi:hypothetical protein
MPRRRRNGGFSLDSDSFLDIVANIVGILIILIVVVGVRVGQSAAAPKAVEPVAAVVAPRPAVQPVVAPRPVFLREPAPVAPAAPEPSPELLASIDRAIRDTERLRAEQLTLQAEAGRLDAEIVALTAEAGTIAEEHVSLSGRLSAAEEAGRVLVAQLDELRSTLDGLGRQISDVPVEQVTVLRHRLNPIGREVRGRELHFRIAGGRIARVPIEELVERLKPQLERQKDWIAKYNRHQGRVGPLEGFTMEYVAERSRLGVVEELRLGAQMMRIVVAGWKVVPEPNLVTESADEALRGDSRFLSVLRLAPPDTTLTFWVYPDSFEAYRRLQEFAHAEGFSVAARPLPHGVPIAGSPQGSRSSSQ